MGGDPVTGFYVTAPIGVAVLTVLHPDLRSQLRSPGRPSVSLLTYAMLSTLVAWIYAVTYADLQHGPATDPHVQLHHWSGVASAALAIAAAAIAASLRGRGWEVVAAFAAGAGILFGLAGVLFADLPGAPGTGWSWLAIAVAVGFWIVSRYVGTRGSPPT
jgi:hypothetical protein